VGIIVLPALLVLLSAALRVFIVNKSGTMSTLGDIGLGLPVDLTFAAFSIIIYSSALNATWLPHHAILIAGLLLAAIFQLGAIYKPCKEYRDDGDFGKSFGLWFLNAVITLAVFSFIGLEVVK